MKYAVSVLIPVYNVSAHIEKCAHSLFNQTLENVEYIFVDDMSPDDSVAKLNAVIEQYPARKNDIKIIKHSINSGQACARMTAFNASSAEYLSFVDSDDFIDTDMLKTLYKTAIKNNADIVVSDIRFVYDGGETLIKPDNISGTGKRQAIKLVEGKDCFNAVWNKLIKRDLFAKIDITFPKNFTFQEDRYFMIQLYFNANTIVKVDKAFYNYVRYNVNATTAKTTAIHFENTITFWHLIEQFFQQQGIYDNYEMIVSKAKVKNKIGLMMSTKSFSLRKKYFNLFRKEEIYWSQQPQFMQEIKLGEKLMLSFSVKRQLRLSYLLYLFIAIKTKFRKKRLL
ncbi:MAG: glycosyltransferase [Candidatus Symbiothrix sp.]|jgi:glycosyltransferase involved in cell wall biosynthesis|nr:glycosyltransferase [Candidatus Symbiothrix sp.]